MALTKLLFLSMAYKIKESINFISYYKACGQNNNFAVHCIKFIASLITVRACIIRPELFYSQTIMWWVGTWRCNMQVLNLYKTLFILKYVYHDECDSVNILWYSVCNRLNDVPDFTCMIYIYFSVLVRVPFVL